MKSLIVVPLQVCFAECRFDCWQALCDTNRANSKHAHHYHIEKVATQLINTNKMKHETLIPQRKMAKNQTCFGAQPERCEPRTRLRTAVLSGCTQLVVSNHESTGLVSWEQIEVIIAPLELVNSAKCTECHSPAVDQNLDFGRKNVNLCLLQPPAAARRHPIH